MAIFSSIIMRKTPKYCILCCVDVNNQRKRKIDPSISKNYTLVGLIQSFCQNVGCSAEALFGSPCPDFTREPFPFCILCKRLMLNLHGLEEEIKILQFKIQGTVRRLLGRCLICRKNDCLTCRQSVKCAKKTPDNQSKSEPDATTCRMRFREDVRSHYLPEVVVEEADPQKLAERHHLKLIQAETVLPCIPAELLIQGIGENHWEPDFCDLDVIQELRELDVDKFEFDGEKLYANEVSASADVTCVRCNFCDGHPVIPNYELQAHFSFHREQINSLGEPKQLEQQSVSPDVEQCEQVSAATSSSQKVEESSCGNINKLRRNNTMKSSRSSSDVARAEAVSRPQTRHQKSKIVRNDTSKKLSRYEILKGESPASFLNLFKVFEFEDDLQGKTEVSVQRMEANKFLLECKWMYEFVPGEGYKCDLCDIIVSSLKDLVTHCKEIHRRRFSMAGPTGELQKMLRSLRLYRTRVKETIETTANWRDSFHITARDSGTCLKAFDYKTKRLGNDRFVYLQKYPFHVTDTEFVCDTCGFKDEWKSVLVHHIFQEHGIQESLALRANTERMEEVTPNKFVYRGYSCQKLGDYYICDKCGFKASAREQIQKHLYSLHYYRDSRTCPSPGCGRVFRDMAVYIEHCKAHDSENPPPPKRFEKLVMIEPNKFSYRGFGVDKIGPRYHCKTCIKYKTLVPSMIIEHIYRVHHRGRNCYDNKKDFVCSSCGKRFQKLSSYRAHLRTHKVGTFVCYICGVIKSNKAALSAHTSLHREKKSECEICGRKFLCPSIVKDHMVFHSEERKYKCLECNKSYKVEKSLRLHQMCHGGKKPFICDICGRGFTQPHTVTKHKRTVHANVVT